VYAFVYETMSEKHIYKKELIEIYNFFKNIEQNSVSLNRACSTVYMDADTHIS